MSVIKPIETVYNGYRFRSRLEARWAVFFDAAGIKYEYEPEGYEVDGTRYLPDFYLPELDVHVEVKPDRSGIEADILKCSKMIRWGGAIKTIVFLGDVPPDSDGGHWHFPALFYNSGCPKEYRVCSGWWFFQDTYNDDGESISVIGHVSGMSYPLPFHFDGETVKGMIKNYGTYELPSTKPVSDRYLRNEDPVMEPQSMVSHDDWLQFLKDSITSINEIFYSALRKARQARFEHGECG